MFSRRLRLIEFTAGMTGKEIFMNDTRFGPAVRAKLRPALEGVGKAVGHALEQLDFHEAGHANSAAGLANAIQKLRSACETLLADPVLENQKQDRKLGGMFSVTKMAQSGGAPRAQNMSRQLSTRQIQEVFRSFRTDAEARACVRELEDHNRAVMDGLQPAAPKRANPLMMSRAMNDYLEPAQSTSADERGRAALLRGALRGLEVQS
jgi:hypothetical protein